MTVHARVDQTAAWSSIRIRHHPRHEASPDVLRPRYRFQVVRVHAGAIAAEVVEFETVRDGATEQLVHHAVSEPPDWLAALPATRPSDQGLPVPVG